MLRKNFLSKSLPESILRPFSSSKRTDPKLNLVIRDHDQSVYANSMNSTLDPRYFQIAHLWNSGNKLGPQQFFGHFEAGGQEPGKTGMSGRNPGELFAKLHQHAPDTWLRSLSRGCYGNSIFPLHPNDLKKWYNFINKHGKKVIYKVFDYNTNFEEMEIALKVISEMGAPIEIAIPHSPDPQYLPYFQKKVEQAAKKAKEYGATLSVKRMVGGITEDEAKRCAEIMVPVALKYGIKDITLHAHGDVPGATAAFIHTASLLGMPIVRGDIVHKLSGGDEKTPGTFPNFYDVSNRLAQLGINIQVNQDQLDILKEIDRIQFERDQRFMAVRVKGAFTVADKVKMGMPDGGEAYTVEAIIKSGIPGKLGITLEKCQELFMEYYLEFRDRFGMVVSVTPGHKRIEEGSLTSMQNTLGWLKDLAKKNGVHPKELSPKTLREGLKTLSYDQLYKDLNPKTVDAFRNNHLPVELSDECMDFLCRSHMKNVLSQKEFDKIENKYKSMLIQHANDEDTVIHIVEQLIYYGKVPHEAGLIQTDEFHPLSIIQAAGKRAYTEGAGAQEIGPKLVDLLKKSEAQGSPISTTFGMEAAECISILTGSHSFVDTAAKHGPVPSPEGFTKEEYEKELAFYRKHILSPPGTLKKEKANLIAGKQEILKAEESKSVNGKGHSKHCDVKIVKDVEEHDKTIRIATLLARELKL